MAIVIDVERKVTVDNDTGEYMVYTPTHWQDPYLHFTIHSASGVPLFGADVERDAIDELGAGGSTVERFIVRRVWFPSGRPEKPTYFFGETEMIGKLEQFIEVWAKGIKEKRPQPRYEFEDGRTTKGDARITVTGAITPKRR